MLYCASMICASEHFAVFHVAFGSCSLVFVKGIVRALALQLLSFVNESATCILRRLVLQVEDFPQNKQRC